MAFENPPMSMTPNRSPTRWPVDVSSSIWMRTAVPPAPTPPLVGKVTADVAVVGAGYNGLSTALHLAERGTSVVLLEAHEPGWGASGRNGGQVIPGLKYDPSELVEMLGPEEGERLATFSGTTADVVFDVIERHKLNCSAARTGWLQGIHSTGALRRAGLRTKEWLARGAHVELLDEDATERALGARIYRGGFVDWRGGRLQPLSYARELTRRVIELGVRVHGLSRVQTLERQGSRWLVKTDAGLVEADRVVLATNAYTDNLWPGLERHVVTVQSMQVATKPLSDNIRKTVMPSGLVFSDTRRLITYGRLDDEGRLICGGRGSLRAEDQVSTDLIENYLSMMQQYFPSIGPIEVDAAWAGKVAMTIDYLPHVLQLGPGLDAVMGCNGRGVALMTAAGKGMADRIHGSGNPRAERIALPARKASPIPLHAFRVPMKGLISAWYRHLDRRDMRH